MPCCNVSINKNYKCEKAACVIIPTEGKSCICVCENESGDIMRCDDCKCLNSDTCQCKCDDSKCTCISTKGANIICVGRDGRGNIKACDCACVESKDGKCYKKKLSAGSNGCCNKEPKEEGCCGSCKCDGKNDFMEVCRNKRGNIKARKNCCIEIDDATCCKKELTCKSCTCCKTKPEKKVCSDNCKCDKNSDFKEACRVTDSKNYKSSKGGCVFIPTGGKPCVCVCEDENGDIMRCDDCKCLSCDSCQCKCDDSKCTCIVTKGADIICVSRDGKGTIRACDCSCVEAQKTRCSMKKQSEESCLCCTKEPEKDDCCGGRCKCSGKKNIIEVRRGNNKACNNYCVGIDNTTCCKKVMDIKFCECCKREPKIKSCGSNCKCNDQTNFGDLRRTMTVSKNYKSGHAECVFIPTGGKSCICVCEDDNGDIMRCDDCKCLNSDTCQCKCDDSKCTCIATKGADTICVSRDSGGNIRACNCFCIEVKNVRCSKKEVEMSPYGCCINCSREPENHDCCGGNCKCSGNKNFLEIHRDGKRNVKISKNCCIDVNDAKCCKKEQTLQSCECREKKSNKKACGGNCKCDENREFQGRRVVADSKNHRRDQGGCVYMPTGGKSCICVCEDDNGDIMTCDDCKCLNSDTCQCKYDDSECTCIVTKGADIICVRRDERRNIKACDCSRVKAKNARCCKTEEVVKTYECCGHDLEKSYGCCNKIQGYGKNNKQGCCVSEKENRCSRINSGGCICVAKKTTNTCICCY